MFVLNYSDHRPIYEQIKEKLKELIVSGAIEPGEQLPSVRETAASLSINPNTIQKAFKSLEAEGYIYSVRGRGSFAAPAAQAVKKGNGEELMERLENEVRELYFLVTDKADIINVIERIYKG